MLSFASLTGLDLEERGVDPHDWTPSEEVGFLEHREVGTVHKGESEGTG